MHSDNLADLQQFEAMRSRALGVVCNALNLWRRRKIMNRIFNQVARLEGGIFFSPTIRRWMARKYGVEVGAYSYGPCLVPGGLPPGVRVGRYVSIAQNARVSQQNKAMDSIIMHPLFYEMAQKSGNPIRFESSLVIEHDAWIGDGALILPGCNRVGIGAVVGGGAVVTTDVPDFAIVAGNPARLLRFRFDEETRCAILTTRWWERSVHKLVESSDIFGKGIIQSPAVAVGN